MLTEERHSIILRILDEKKAASISEFAAALGASESTVRRDLTALHEEGKLCKVYGGATASDGSYSAREEAVAEKNDLHKEDKLQIARAAAEWIEPKEFVYIDAGTTTDRMIEFLPDNDATYVTNGVLHAHRLASRGFKAYILGGLVKSTTAAVAGEGALEDLERCHFTKGFFGVNGISLKAGYTTPEQGEGFVKRKALSRCQTAYILADPSKFNRISPISFGKIGAAAIVTTVLPDPAYREHTKIIEVKEP